MKNELMEDKTIRSTQQATLTFDLEDFEAKRNLKKMLDVDDYLSVLWDFKEKILRGYFKYNEGNKVRFKPRGDAAYKEVILDFDTMEYIEDAFYSLLEENEINLDKLVV